MEEARTAGHCIQNHKVQKGLHKNTDTLLLHAYAKSHNLQEIIAIQ